MAAARRSIWIARLGIALVSVTNATAALAAPSAPACGRAGMLAAIEAAGPHRGQVRVQRPPRVPRREPLVAGTSAPPAAGPDV
jgi:hypothetical protein